MTTNPDTEPVDPARLVANLRNAQRRVRSTLIANADRLSTPFTDDPGKNPWDTFVRPAMRELQDAVRSACEALAAVPAAVSVPPPTRAALHQAADIAEDVAESLRKHHEFERSTGALDVMTELRRLAAEAQQQPDTETHEDLPARLEAALTERFTELGNPFSEMRRHEQGPDGWPASHPVGPAKVAEVLRELLAVAPPAVGPGRVADEEPATVHSCKNCLGIDPDTCLMNPNRPKQPMDPVHILGIYADQPAVPVQPAAADTREETGADHNAGPGWYEVINPRTATTNIAFVHEDGTLYLPEGDDALTAGEFAFAAARGNAHRLVRADEEARP